MASSDSVVDQRLVAGKEANLVGFEVTLDERAHGVVLDEIQRTLECRCPPVAMIINRCGAKALSWTRQIKMSGHPPVKRSFYEEEIGASGCGRDDAIRLQHIEQFSEPAGDRNLVGCRKARWDTVRTVDPVASVNEQHAEHGRRELPNTFALRVTY